MRVEIEELTDVNEIFKSAYVTSGINKDISEMTENEKLVKLELFLKNRHSPIRSWMFRITMYDIPYYNSMHFARHTIGVTHYIKSQRHGIDRHEIPQDSLVNHSMVLNAESIMNISDKRLCNCTEKNTQNIMYAIKQQMVYGNVYMRLLGNYMNKQCFRFGYCIESLDEKPKCKK